MASWDQTSPAIKFEDSPAESFVSTPGEPYPSLFGDASVTTPNTVGPSDMLTPPPVTDDATVSTTPTPSSTSPEKKPVKKRKSWGQVLPEPKTNLPPRKRAKTEDEKEQRRVERVLRNRRAAQSSRERKRLEVEALEKRNKELEAALQNVTKANHLLVEELNKFRRDSGILTRSSSPLDSLRPNAVTLSPALFSSQDGHRPSLDDRKSLVNDLMVASRSNATVNPASLSPELSPVVGNSQVDIEESKTAEMSTANPTSDLTQRPAAMLCDLQCHQSEAVQESRLASQILLHPTFVLFLQLQMLLITSSAILSVCQRPLTQIAMSLKAGFSLPPTPSIMSTIIWLVTLPPSSRTRSTSPSSSTMRLTPQPSRRSPMPVANSPTLRLRYLQRILTCSPTLARPLMDATMEVLRLGSEDSDDRVGGVPIGCSKWRDSRCGSPMWLSCMPIPSKEVLLTLLWSLRVEERKMSLGSSLGNTNTLNPSCVASTSVSFRRLTVASKRKPGDVDMNDIGKRLRLA